MIACRRCGRTILRSARAVFCSARCGDAYRAKARYQPHPLARAIRTCPTCGATGFRRGQRYCSLGCRPLVALAPLRRLARSAAQEARRAAREAEHAQRRVDELNAAAARYRSCQQCGDHFWAADTTGRQRFCGADCRSAWHQPPPAPELIKTCLSCATTFATIHPNARYCQDQCRRRAGKKGITETRRRRLHKSLAPLRDRVVALFGRRCHICGYTITTEPDHADPDSLTLDHVVPLAAGGSHDISNLRPAHRLCNSARRDQPIGFHWITPGTEQAWADYPIVSGTSTNSRRGVAPIDLPPVAMAPPHG